MNSEWQIVVITKIKRKTILMSRSICLSNPVNLTTNSFSRYIKPANLPSTTKIQFSKHINDQIKPDSPSMLPTALFSNQSYRKMNFNRLTKINIAATKTITVIDSKLNLSWIKFKWTWIKVSTTWVISSTSKFRVLLLVKII